MAKKSKSKNKGRGKSKSTQAIKNTLGLDDGFKINTSNASVSAGRKIGAYPYVITEVDKHGDNARFRLHCKSTEKGNSSVYRISMPNPSEDPEDRGQFAWLRLKMSLLNLSEEDAKNDENKKVVKFNRILERKGANGLLEMTGWLDHDDRGRTYRNKKGVLLKSADTILITEEAYDDLAPTNAERIAAFKVPLKSLPSVDDDDLDDDLEDEDDDDDDDDDDDF